MFQEQRAEACFFLILHLLFIAQVAHLLEQMKSSMNNFRLPFAFALVVDDY